MGATRTIEIDTAAAEARFDNVDREILKVQAEQVLLKWMVGFGIALDVAILIRVFFR